ncbi:MAG: TrmB family transcriptional regulator [Thermoplasmata archaeon]|nr:TrmB family transcriptional regulator [Thermoplasmata archaeon]
MEHASTSRKLSEEIREVTAVMESLGLSKYEARTYIALVAHGQGPADLIAETAGIPRTSCYKALESLEERGMAHVSEGRPRIFRAEHPAAVRKMFESRIEEAFSKLEMAYEVLSERGIPQLVYTIVGKDRVLAKMGELLDGTERRFIISTPLLSEIRRHLRKEIKNALYRGVEVVVITEPGQRVPEGVVVHRRRGLIATDVISDGVRALLVSPDLNACGYTDNPSLASHLERFLEIVMAHGGHPDDVHSVGRGSGSGGGRRGENRYSGRG